MEQESEDETDEDRRMFTTARKTTHRIDHPTTPGAKASWDRTLLDILLETSKSAWKRESAFTVAARKLPLRDNRRQELSARQAAHQCLETVLTEQEIDNLPIRFQDLLNFGMFHDVLTTVQAEYLQKFANRRAVDRE